MLEYLFERGRGQEGKEKVPPNEKLTRIYSDEFEEDLKKVNDDVEEEVSTMIDIIVFTGKPLTDSIYKNHTITRGNQRGLYDAHVPVPGDNLLLMYEIEGNTLFLHRLSDHATLFAKAQQGKTTTRRNRTKKKKGKAWKKNQNEAVGVYADFITWQESSR